MSERLPNLSFETAFWAQFNGLDSPAGDALETQTEQTSTESPAPSDVEAVSDLVPTGQSQLRHGHDSLPLLQPADWSQDKTYNEKPPTCIHYSIEWKLTVNSKQVARETEPDLVLAPSAFWATFLRPKLDKLLARKLPQNKSFRADDTAIVVSVTDRTERDLVKRFDELDIDWAILEKQLKTWSHLFRAGKRLRIDISFHYLETGDTVGASTRQGTKRGYSSASQYMLSERAMQLDAEEDAAGRPSIWRDVYNLMRCPGPPCNLGPHCWRDSVGKKHYKLRTHHLKSLIKHVEQGAALRTHDDVPDDIREQLYAEEQQDAEHRRKRRASSLAGYPPINITNVLPSQAAGLDAGAPTPASAGAVQSRPLTCLEIPGPRDIAVMRYSEWQRSQVSNTALKMEYQKACDLTLAEGLDLELVWEDQHADFYIQKGIKSGVARRFVRDIEVWARQHNIA
ncbi:uncharacterized protein LTHEOB_12920 [Lasiodiplodia theobromae]|uniref:uncharacterized protein n=1 Tax=Lasiodiplodia theobromae TaxID=45133 RepID=UPI0015C3E9EC|nr:uncharacterized protein LTHEOB_12920 [Lasiodiplodia theobromae]KAF4534642.1 hypothetical protein LTHEOB_12920 [Lasiodiplodia theobromae]